MFSVSYYACPRCIFFSTPRSGTFETLILSWKYYVENTHILPWKPDVYTFFYIFFFLLFFNLNILSGRFLQLSLDSVWGHFYTILCLMPNATKPSYLKRNLLLIFILLFIIRNLSITYIRLYFFFSCPINVTTYRR